MWKSCNVAVPANRVFAHQEKKIWKAKDGSVYESEDKKFEVVLYFLRTILAKQKSAASLHVLIFVCFQRFHLFSPLSALLKKYPVNAEGHFQNSSELPGRKATPPLSLLRFLGLHSESQGGRGAAALFHSHSSLMALKCIIMQM